MTSPYFAALSALLGGLAGVKQAHNDDPTIDPSSGIFRSIAAAAQAYDDAAAGGLPTLRERIRQELQTRRGRLIHLGRQLFPLGVKIGTLLDGRPFVHPTLPELEAEAARLMQLEDLLPWLERDALLVTLGAVTTYDGRSDYMGLARVLDRNAGLSPDDDRLDAEEPANDPPCDGTCCNPDCQVHTPPAAKDDDAA